MDTATRTAVTVLVVVGDQAELTTPTRTAENPLRVPAADITADTGIPRGRLPGRRLTAVVTETIEDGMTARDYQVSG
jgi:hypothetical protein